MVTKANGAGPAQSSSNARAPNERGRSWNHGGVPDDNSLTNLRRPSRRASSTVLSILTVLALATSACSDSSGSDAGGTSTTAAGPTSTAVGESGSGDADAPEQYSGDTDGFNEVPDPLPAGEPGELIRVQQLDETSGYVNLRVMYHSLDARGSDRAVTGTISYPTTDAPDGGWPVVAWAHGTTGLASQCAPSRVAQGAPGFGIEGVHVATDYIGLGPVGEIHSYLSGLSEAQPVVDSVRAARNLADSNASTRWIALGHSQGGHAALFTHEIGASYAPELEFLGSVVSAPAAVLDKTFGPGDEVVPRMVGLMALYGIAQDHPDLDPDDYASDLLEARADIITTACTQDVIDQLVTVPPEDLYDVHPLQDPVAREVVMANDPGHVAVDAPMLLLYGTLDWWVVPDRVKFLFNRLCDIGQVAEIVEVPDADHGNLMEVGADPITAWLQARIAGEPAPDSCSDPNLDTEVTNAIDSPPVP